MKWEVVYEKKEKPNLKNPVLLVGLPGIGNVGKVVVDFIIEKIKAERLCEISSYSFPPSVYINEENMVELPQIELYYKKRSNHKEDIILLAGDIQPIDEISSYSFTDVVLDIIQQYKTKEIITLGGIGLSHIPKKPRVFCAANTKKIVEKYVKGTDLNPNSYGVIGPIMGVAGLLVGMAKKRNIPAIAMLAETYSHPMYLGIKGARSILHILNQKLNLNLSLKDLDKEIKEIEQEMKKIKGLDSQKQSISSETNYIG